MLEYYYSDGEKQFGPFTLDQLTAKKLDADTLIWHEQLNDWSKLKDLPEIADKLVVRKNPPPLRTSGKTISPSNQGKGNKIVFDKNIISQKVLKWLGGWTALHFFAMMVSYAQVPLFNNLGEPRSENFWPFVNFMDDYYVKVSSSGTEIWETKLKFNGIFVNYDWTECATYISSVLLFALFYYLYKKAE